MKAVILAGGLGTRLLEETVLRPKPMVEIGGKPILWHIMQIHAAHGIREFILALGYKGEMVKEYFLNFFAINNDLSVDLSTGKDDYSRWKSTKMDRASCGYGVIYTNWWQSETTEEVVR